MKQLLHIMIQVLVYLFQIQGHGNWQVLLLLYQRSIHQNLHHRWNSPDVNYFVRISQYSQNILNNIPDKTSYSGWTIDNSLYNADADALTQITMVWTINQSLLPEQILIYLIRQRWITRRSRSKYLQ